MRFTIKGLACRKPRERRSVRALPNYNLVIADHRRRIAPRICVLETRIRYLGRIQVRTQLQEIDRAMPRYNETYEMALDD